MQQTKDMATSPFISGACVPTTAGAHTPCNCCDGRRYVMQWGREQRTCGYCNGMGFVVAVGGK